MITKIKKDIKKKGGFTLAELLIVVAIIAVLVAISIPVFTAQLEKSRAATDAANIRAAYAQLTADYLAYGSEVGKSDNKHGKDKQTVKMKHQKPSTVIEVNSAITGRSKAKTVINGNSVELTIDNKTGVVTLAPKS